jgi:hypothetical protein
MAFKIGNTTPLIETITQLRTELEQEKQQGKVIAQHLALLSSALQQDIKALNVELVQLQVFSEMRQEQLSETNTLQKKYGTFNNIKLKVGDAAKIDDTIKKEIILTLSLITNLLTFTSGKWMSDLEEKGVKAFGDKEGKIPEMTGILRNLNMKCNEHLSFLTNAINSTVSFKGVQPGDLAQAVREKEQQLVDLAGAIQKVCKEQFDEYNTPPTVVQDLHASLKQFIEQQTVLQADIAKIRLAIIPQRIDELKQEADTARAALSEYLKKQKQVAPAGKDAIMGMLEQDIKEYFRLGIEMHEVLIEAAIQLHLLKDKPVPDTIPLFASATALAGEAYEQHSFLGNLQTNYLSKQYMHQNKMAEFTQFAEKTDRLRALIRQGMSLTSPNIGWKKPEINSICDRLRQMKMKEKGMDKVRTIEILQTIPNKLILFWDWVRFHHPRVNLQPSSIAESGYPCTTFSFLANDFPEPAGGITDPDALYAAFLKTVGIGSLQELLPKQYHS